MRSQDIYILLKLVCLQQHELSHSPARAELRERYSVRGLSVALGISKTEVSASIRRSIDANMAIKDRKSGYPRVNKKALLDFVIHGLKYVFPVKPAEIVRGIPAAFSAPMLEGKILSMSNYIYVWPYAEGREKGQSIKPLFKSLPKAALGDECLYECLALVDAIRIGGPREANLAAKIFKQRLFS